MNIQVDNPMNVLTQGTVIPCSWKPYLIYADSARHAHVNPTANLRLTFARFVDNSLVLHIQGRSIRLALDLAASLPIANYLI